MATAQTDIQNKIQTGKRATKVKSSVKELYVSDNLNVHENIDVEEIKKSSEEDLESLLKLAENLKENIDKPKIRIKFFRFSQITFITMLIYSCLVYYYTSFLPIPLWMATPTIVLLIILLVLWEGIIRKYLKSIFSDKLALKEVLQLLREVHGTIAEREDWSILKRAEFRIRLSRFDLSEKKDSVFSFFS